VEKSSMSARWEGEEALLQPITPERPCGDNLEDTDLLASFDSYRLFGQSRSLDAPPPPPQPGEPLPPPPPDWPAIRAKSVEALGRSKDLRLLAHLAAALLRTDGVPAFAATLNVASQWLESYWTQVYPLVDEDAILRRSALNNFADPMAMVDRLRRTSLVDSRQHGKFSLRDLDIATGQLTPAAGDRPVDANQINAAFDAMPLEELTLLHDSVATAVAAVRKIETAVREAAGSESTPTLDPLSTQLGKMNQVLRTRLAARTAGADAPAENGDAAAPAPGGVAISGVVKSRQDAIRALEAIAAFYRQAEPSSPIPLLLERAKRLVSKDFLEVLADIAPDAVATARAAGGLKESSE
jgi:type VI secretion system protein ImpA